MIIPYRIQQALRRLGIGLMVLLVLASVLLLCWFLWLQRYVVYTEDGAKLDFDISLQFPDGQVAQKPTTGGDVNLIYGDEIEATGPATKEMERFSGYYVTVDAMREDFDAVQDIAQWRNGDVRYEEHPWRILLQHQPGPHCRRHSP